MIRRTRGTSNKREAIGAESLPIEVEKGAPLSPTRAGPPKDWKHRKLYDRVWDALHALPARFRTKLSIAGVSATDLFTLNTPLGAAIEASVVENLNDLRDLWDPDGEYPLHSFVRQPQVFPDVRFQTSAPNVDSEDAIIFGIELKGWFLLAKEGEPSFRYKVSPMCCAMADLMVVYPWVLDEVTSGEPRLLRPFIEEARYAAEHRNYYWRYGRGRQQAKAAASREIKKAAHTTPYPAKKDKFNDEPVFDSGKNFGRVARGGLMTSFIQALVEEPLAGIPAKHWQSFLRIFASGVDDTTIAQKLQEIEKEVRDSPWATAIPEEVDDLMVSLRRLIARTS